jgi:heme A synthase
MSSWKIVATSIIGVLVSTAFLAWMMWRVCRSAERAERDSKYLRRRLFGLGMIYVAAAVFGIVEVATGREPIQALIGLPIGATFAWLYLRAAVKVGVPPGPPSARVP